MVSESQTLLDFLRQTDLDDALLVGYYGGGNFGDELLLEILLNIMHRHRPSARTRIYYLHPEWYASFHKDFGHEVIDAKSILSAVRAYGTSKSIVVGGGGLWGLDFNIKVLFLSVMLLIGRLLGKKVYLLGVGFYDSTNRLGRVGAWCAGKAAVYIFARDDESYRNFSAYSTHVTRSSDFSSLLPDIDAGEYESSVRLIKDALPITKLTLLICVRHFKPEYNESFQTIITEIVQRNSDKDILLLILEPQEINPEGYEFIQNIANGTNIRAADFTFNPAALYFYLQSLGAQLVIIAPHYHMIVMAILSRLSFFPIVYDNKVRQLLDEHNAPHGQTLDELQADAVQDFIDKEYR